MNIIKIIDLLWKLKKSQKQGRLNTMEAKNFLQSKTIWGLILIAAGAAKTNFGWDFSDAEIERWLNWALEVFGLLWAAWGRWKASQPIKIK